MTTDENLARAAFGERPELRTAVAVRLRLTRRDAGMVVLSPVLGLVLCAWMVVVVGAALTVLLPLLSPATALVRRCCDFQRAWVSTHLGRELRTGYRSQPTGVVPRAFTVMTDPATWRDATWMAWQSLAGWVLASCSVSLLLGGVFYLGYPLWYAIAPPPVFREPFGRWSELHSCWQSCAVIPVSVICLALWFVVTVPLTRAQMRVSRSLLFRARGGEGPPA
ncbi:MAG: sensor domain-containing protein [Nocardioides sp.]